MNEALNLNTLTGVLPQGQLKVEKDVSDKFRAAALGVTELFKTSMHASKRAYNAGYAAACQDILSMIQNGVSVGGVDSMALGSSPDSPAMSVGKVMDWIEARMDEIKWREEEEDEDAEREKQQSKTSGSVATTVTKSEDKPLKTENIGNAPRQRDQPTSLPTPNSPRQLRQPTCEQPPSPSPPPSSTSSSRLLQRTPKARSVKADSPVSPPSLHVSLPEVTYIPPITPASIQAGAKRRHAMMMMLDATSSPTTSSSPLYATSTNTVLSQHPHSIGLSVSNPNSSNSRRRIRSNRSGHGHGHGYPLAQLQNQNHPSIISSSEAMEVEEDGRERKRTARR